MTQSFQSVSQTRKPLRTLAIAAALVFAFGTAFACFAGHVTASAAPQPNTIAIVHTNDIHCSYQKTEKTYGYAEIAAFYAQVRQEYGEGNTLLVDAGDFVSGAAVGTLSKGQDVVTLVNAVGYDAAAVGNHEFDYTAAHLSSLAGTMDFPFVSCNFKSLKTDSLVFSPYEMLTAGDKKIAFVGVTSPESLTKSNPSNFWDEKGNVVYNFYQDETGQALYDCIQATVDAARMDGADYVILLSHLGLNGITERWRADVVVAHLSGVDAVIDGHSHEIYDATATVRDADGNDIPIAQEGYQGEGIGKLVINTETGSITEEPVSAGTTAIEPDAAVAQLVDRIAQGVEEAKKTVCGVASTDLLATSKATEGERVGKRLARTGETNLGDLITDAYRAYFQSDIALLNGGALRTEIAAGDVNYGNLLDVMPFSNDLCAIQATGQQIADALEMGVRLYPQENGGFLQASGLTFEFRTDIDSTVQLDETDAFAGVSGERRVRNICVNGSPLDLEGLYSVAGIEYMLKNGGDGYSMFKGCPVLQDSGLLDVDVAFRFVKENLGGYIGSDYANGDGGRGSIVPTSGEEPQPVPVPSPEPTPEPQSGKSGSGTVPGTGDPVQPLVAGFGMVAFGAMGVAAFARTRRRAA